MKENTDKVFFSYSSVSEYNYTTMSGAVAKLAKPAMRGMHVAQIKKNITLAALVGFCCFICKNFNLNISPNC